MSVKSALDEWVGEHESSPDVLSFDPSSRCTGYAFFRSQDELVDCGLLRRSSKCITEMACTLFDEIQSVIRDHKPDLIVIEAPSGKVARRLGGRGAGLSVYGVSVGIVAGASIAARGRHFMGRYSVLLIDEPLWTRSRSKLTRRAEVELAFPRLKEIRERDVGMDAADAVGVGIWLYDQLKRVALGLELTR